MLRQQDVGHRVVVRRIVGVRDGRPLFSDALGELVELTESHLTLLTTRGPLRVPLPQVHRAKRIPPARRPTAESVVELELAANEAWPAPVQRRLGGWLLRAAEGWTGRGNSALPIGDPDRPLPEAIEAVRRWYAERGRPALINVPLPLAAPVGHALDKLGWTARPPVLVQTARLTTLLAADAPAPAQPVQVRLTATPSADWLAMAAARMARARIGDPSTDPPAELPSAARHLLTAVPSLRFAHVHRAGPGPAELLAVARGTITGNGRWLGITLLEVVPAARRQGLARLVLHALAEWAAEAGATDAFLQVAEHNRAAVTLYQRLGFRTHHTYATHREPD